MTSGGSRAFQISVLVVGGFFIGFSAANIAYYNRIRNGEASNITQDEGLTMMVINVVLLLIAIALFFWAIYVISFSSSARKKIVEYVSAPSNGFITLDEFDPVTGSIRPANQPIRV